MLWHSKKQEINLEFKTSVAEPSKIEQLSECDSLQIHLQIADQRKLIKYSIIDDSEKPTEVMKIIDLGR